MGIIRLKNVRIYAHHGCLDEEEIIGSDYRVDLEVTADLQTSSQSDNLADTADYVALNQIIKEEMAIRAKLLETVAARINARILKELPLVSSVTVEVAKLNPPIGGDVQEVVISLRAQR